MAFCETNDGPIYRGNSEGGYAKGITKLCGRAEQTEASWKHHEWSENGGLENGPRVVGNDPRVKK
jgi:hypothetical protein